MTIKKLVVGSMFSMLLGSEMAAADWDDVYYCQMTNFLGITLKGEKKNYTPEKFQFKLDQTKNAMVFGSTGYFTNSVSKLVKGSNWPSLEKWYANGTYSSTYFDDGKLLYTFNNVMEAGAVSADCDKF
jgi:hypothetical protein